MNIRRHLAWWIALALLVIAWTPLGIAELLHKFSGLNYYPDEQVALMFGFWLFIWWPCHIIVALVVLYKLVQWALRSRSLRKA